MKRFLLFILITSCSFGFSQKVDELIFHVDHQTLKLDVNEKDSAGFNPLKQKAFDSFTLEGFIGLTIVDSNLKKNELHYYLSYEQYFKKVHLVNNKDVTASELPNTYNAITKELVQLENNGYPFAKVIIKNQNIIDEKLIINYEIDSGNYLIIDKIHIKSQDKFNPKTILNIIGLKEGDPYNESKLKKIDHILKSSDLYSLLRPVEIMFFKNTAELYLYIKKEKSSTADGYVGLLQDKVTRKISLNGYVNLKLKNTLNQGELMNLNWKANPDKTQKLLANFEYPFIFNTPFGVEANLNLHKQDTTFVRSDFSYGANYNQPFYKIGIFNQIENSYLIDTNYFNDFRDFSKNTIGLKIEIRPIFNDLLRFYRPKLESSIGFFKYKSDSIISSTNVQNIKIFSELTQTFYFLKYFNFENSIAYNFVQSNYNLSRNELIYFGGLKSLRGFYELELNGNHVFILKNEIEYKPISSISLKLLYDYSNYLTNQSTNYTNSFGFGFGLISDNSKLEIIVANGNLNNSKFDVGNTKIHIGFSSNF